MSYGVASALRETPLHLILWLTFLDVILTTDKFSNRRCHLAHFQGACDLRKAAFLGRHRANIPYVLCRFPKIVCLYYCDILRKWWCLRVVRMFLLKAGAGKGQSHTPGARQRRIISPLAPSPRSKASSSLALTSLDFCRTWVLTLSEVCFPWTGQRQKDV